MIPATGNYKGYPTSDITDQIRDYKAGKISFDDLRASLANRHYEDPSHYSIDEATPGDIEDADRSEPGTWGEVEQAQDLGLLTYPEYQAISEASHAAHAPS